MKLVFKNDEVLQLIRSALRDPGCSNMLPECMDPEKLVARFVDQPYGVTVEISDEAFDDEDEELQPQPQ